MLKMALQFKEKAKQIKALYQGFQFIRKTEVVVGITEESDCARENGITNAQLLYLHENGVPSHNIPPRPVLKPAISKTENSQRIAKLMRDGMKAAMVDGDLDAARQCYERAGMLGRDACKNYIREGSNLAPNAPQTVARKGSSTPLIDTASMLNSITYAVRKK